MQVKQIKGSSGFSLVEILVATTILLVIVVLVSMVFQQQSAAFQAGVDRTQGQSALRSVMGMVSRDLSMAVDSEDYPDLPPKAQNKFSSESLSFLALTGVDGKNNAGEESEGTLSLQLIKYSYENKIVKREVSNISFSKGGWKISGEDTESDLNSKSNPINDLKFIVEGGTSTMPNNIRIQASTKANTTASPVSGHSAGPNSLWNDDDDIFVGGRMNE